MTLDELVDSFSRHDREIKAIKKVYEEEKGQLKQYFAKTDDSEYSYGGYTVKYSTYETEKVNEEIMLGILKEYWNSTGSTESCPFIKTKEYVDTDELERWLYAEKIPQDIVIDLNKAITTTTVEKITCTKTKSKNDNKED